MRVSRAVIVSLHVAQPRLHGIQPLAVTLHPLEVYRDPLIQALVDGPEIRNPDRNFPLE
jgi:hypothetical protein